MLILFLLLAGLLGVDEVAGGVVRSPQEAAPALRVMSFNIRFDNPRDGEHAWPHRRERVAQVVGFYQVDLLGVQEALEHQVREMAADLGYLAWVGVGRADGMDAGEFSPIYFRKDRLEAVEWGTFWLSETPEEPGSKGWDAALPRIATWARLRDLATGGELMAFNTHFDHAGQEARRQSARLLVERAREMAGDLPVIIMGDFNALPTSQTYRTLSEAYVDTREASETGHFGPDGTFGTFETQKDPAVRIDYIFVSQGIRVLRAATLAHHWEGRHASDHWPVFAEVVVSD